MTNSPYYIHLYENPIKNNIKKKHLRMNYLNASFSSGTRD